MKIAERVTRGLEYGINLLDKAAAGWGRIDSSFERSSTVGKMLSESTTCYRKIVKGESVDAANSIVDLF